MKRYYIYKTFTIKEAIDAIDDSRDRVVIVLNENDLVIGVVSQGDIIRALRDGKNIYTRVEGIIRTGFYYLFEKDYVKAYQIFKNKKITLLPIVDEDFKLIDVITLGDIYDYLEGERNE